MVDSSIPLAAAGIGSLAYSQAVAVYLGLGVARYANSCTTLCTWNPGEKKEDIRFTFSRQALAMTWDFAEGNPFSNSSGNFADNFETWIFKSLLFLPKKCTDGTALQADATSQTSSEGKDFRLTRRTTTTLVTPIYPTSSTFGFVAR